MLTDDAFIHERVIIMIVTIECKKNDKQNQFKRIQIIRDDHKRHRHRDRKTPLDALDVKKKRAIYTTSRTRFSVFTSFASVAFTLVESWGFPSPLPLCHPLFGGREPATYERRTTRATTSNKGSSPSPEVRLGVSGVSIYLVVGRPIGDLTGNRDD